MLRATAAPAAGDDEPALRADAITIADVLHADRPDHTSALVHASVRIDGDAARLFGWQATTFHIEWIADEGGKPNARVQTAQGLSSIEVRRNAVRPYAAWLQHELAPRASVLVGLYDLNSEFYATDASALLIHPAFGVGAELAQTGRNGPSIFPDLAFGTRLAIGAANGAYAQTALLSASAGDPAHPGPFAIRISRSDGALVVAEAGWRGDVETRRGGDQWGVGAWRYSEPAMRLDGSGTARSAGAYVLGQALLAGDAGGARVAVFGRAGVANAAVNAIEQAFDAGVFVRRRGDDLGPHAWSAGIAVARFGAPYRAGAAAARAARDEIALEVDARWRFGAHVALQPLLEHVVHPGGRAATRATIVGVRVLWSFAPRDD